MSHLSCVHHGATVLFRIYLIIELDMKFSSHAGLCIIEQTYHSYTYRTNKNKIRGKNRQSRYWALINDRSKFNQRNFLMQFFFAIIILAFRSIIGSLGVLGKKKHLWEESPKICPRGLWIASFQNRPKERCRYLRNPLKSGRSFAVIHFM